MTEIGEPRLGLGLVWEASDPAGVARSLGQAVGFAIAIDRPVAIGGLSIVVREPVAHSREKLVMVPRPATAEILDRVDVALAIGWATVDLERAFRDLVAVHIIEAGPLAADPPDVDSDDILGATVWPIVATAFGCAIRLLEPVTEGRLAGALVRHGEGPCAIYADLETGATPVLAAGPRDGPFLIVRRPGYHRHR